MSVFKSSSNTRAFLAPGSGGAGLRPARADAGEGRA